MPSSPRRITAMLRPGPGRPLEARGVDPPRPEPGDVTLNPHRLINRTHVTILGCWGYEYTHLHRALGLQAQRRQRFPWASLVTREYRLADAASALFDMERLAVVKALIRP